MSQSIKPGKPVASRQGGRELRRTQAQRVKKTRSSPAVKRAPSEPVALQFKRLIKRLCALLLFFPLILTSSLLGADQLLFALRTVSTQVPLREESRELLILYVDSALFGACLFVSLSLMVWVWPRKGKGAEAASVSSPEAA